MIDVLFKSSIENADKCIVEGQDPDEITKYVYRRSFITNFDWIFVTILLLLTPPFANTILAFARGDIEELITPFFAFTLNVFWYLFTFGFAFQNFLNWFFNLYIITNKRIIDIDFVGFLYKNISETSLDNIEDVTSTVRGALRIIFNYGTVTIQTAGQQREFEFTDVAYPSKVRDIIADIIVERRRTND